MAAAHLASLRRRASEAGYWPCIALLVALKLAIVSDLSVQINYAPADDSLYVLRAFYLLGGHGFGPYDSNVLVKYPGLSFWLALTRLLGIPFILSVQAVYVGAGLYLLEALRKGGTDRTVLLVAFALYLFNPVTLGYEWIRVIREPLSTGLLAALFGAMGHILLCHRSGGRAFGHVAALSLLFAFSLYLREEDRLLWGMLVLFSIAQVWQRTQQVGARNGGWMLVIATLLFPAATAKAYEVGIRSYIERTYGLPLIHEFGEGEYPRLLAAIRGIRAAKENRMVMVTQEALGKLREEVPSFRVVADRLPKPGPGTYSCQFHGVCSEWSNGWMPFWIKDEAFRAGLTPTLPAAQEYFRKVRKEIEDACTQGRIACTPRGSAMIPPMELRWTRAYVAEVLRLLRWSVAPSISQIDAPPLVFDAPLELGRIYQAVTMAEHFDTQLQAGLGAPDVPRLYRSPVATWRNALVTPFRWLAMVFIVAAMIAMLLRVWGQQALRAGPVAILATLFVAYTLARLAILGYVAVFMGQFSPRMVFSTNALAALLALPYLEDAWRTFRSRESEGRSG